MRELYSQFSTLRCFCLLLLSLALTRDSLWAERVNARFCCDAQFAFSLNAMFTAQLIHITAQQPLHAFML
jgi:hypothetical protein